LYTDDLATGLRVIESSFSFLALPFIFTAIKDLNERRLVQISTAFSSGLLLACCICLINALINYAGNHDIQSFFFYNLTDVIRSQPTYLAYYLIFAITFSLYALNYGKINIAPLVVEVLILFFFLMLILTGGQTAFMSLLLVCSFFLLKFILEEKTSSRNWAALLASILIVIMFFISSYDQGTRQSILNDSWDRMALWKSAIVANPDVLFGVGTGDYKSVLNEYYVTHGMHQFAEDSFNAHNQFIQIFFSNGILGLIAVLLLIGRPLYLAVQNDYPFGILVFFPFIIYGMTEVFLGRYQGIVFFALLHQLFLSYYLSSKPAFALKGS